MGLIFFLILGVIFPRENLKHTGLIAPWLGRFSIGCVIGSIFIHEPISAKKWLRWDRFSRHKQDNCASKRLNKFR